MGRGDTLEHVPRVLCFVRLGGADLRFENLHQPGDFTVKVIDFAIQFLEAHRRRSLFRDAAGNHLLHCQACKFGDAARAVAAMDSA